MTMVSLKNSAAVFSLSTCVALGGVVLLWCGDLRALSFILGIFTSGVILGRILARCSYAIVAFLLLVIGAAVVSQATTPVVRNPTLEDVWGTLLLWAIWDGQSPTFGWEFVGMCAFVLGLGVVGILFGHHLRPSPASPTISGPSRPKPLESAM